MHTYSLTKNIVKIDLIKENNICLTYYTLSGK